MRRLLALLVLTFAVVPSITMAEEPPCACSADKFPSATFAMPDGMRILSTVEPRDNFDVTKLAGIMVLEKGEKHIYGDKLMERAKKHFTLGIDEAKIALERQDQIPANLRGKVLLFPGTILEYTRDSMLAHRFPYLEYNGKQWVLDYAYVNAGGIFGRSHLFATYYKS